MSAWFCRSIDGKAARKIVPPRLRMPYWEGLGADSEEKHEPVSDIDTVVVDSLKALDPKWPIREADVAQRGRHVRSCQKRTSWHRSKQHLNSITPAERAAGPNRSRAEASTNSEM